MGRAKTCRVSPPWTFVHFLSRSPPNTCVQATCEKIKANAPVIRAWLWAARGSFGALGCFSIIDRRLLRLFARKMTRFGAVRVLGELGALSAARSSSTMPTAGAVPTVDQQWYPGSPKQPCYAAHKRSFSTTAGRFSSFGQKKTAICLSISLY